MKYKNHKLWLASLALAAGVCASSVQGADVFTPGFTKFEAYTNIAGTTVDLLTSDPTYPGSPAETRYVAGLESPSNYGDNYGGRLTGFVTPPESGSYVFYISSDDAGEFWLSTDATPGNLQLLCTEPQWNGVRDWTTTARRPGAENISVPTQLTAGQRYYFQALVKEGGGGDNLAVTAVKNGAAAPASGSAPLQGAWVGANIPDTGASVQITAAPANVSSPANENVTLTADATGTSPLGTEIVYFWRKNGSPIPGANSKSLTLNRVQSSDNGSKYSVTASIPGATATSTEATLTVTADVTKPTLVSARATANFKTVNVVFSEPLDSASATATANYALSGGATVSGATLVNDTTVRLTTSALAENTTYTLTVNNVKDTFNPGNAIAANSTVTFKSYAFYPNAVLNKFWDNFTANTIAALNALATYPNNPDRVLLEPRFEYPLNGGGEGGANYGNTLEAWFTAPSSGDYVFFCSGDDPVNLYLSTDADPANAKLIAAEPSWNNPRDWTGTARRTDPENRSDAYAGSQWPTPNKITLTGGSKYYLRAEHTEGGGGDNVGATYIKAGAADPAVGSPPIEGAELGFYYDPTDSAVAIGQQPASTSVLQGRTVTVSVGATGKWQYAAIPFYQWQSAPSGSTTFTDIAGATSASYTSPELAVGDSGTQYRVLVSVPGASSTSSAAVITVQADTQAPKITKVSASSSDALSVTFDEKLDPATANTAANYKLAPGNLNITTATIGGANSNVVRLEVSGAIAAGSQYTITVNGVKDLFGNTVNNASSTFTARIVTYADIILADKPIAFYRFEETTGQKTANLGTFGAAGDGLYMAGTGPDDSSPADARTEAGPRPAQGFLGFAGSNRAANFSGPDDPFWVDTQNQFLNNLGSFSLEYWVRPSGGRLADPSTWGTRVGIVGQNDAIEYGFIDQNTIQIWTPGGGSLDTDYTFPDDEWHHVATIATGSGIRNYFDGKLVGSGGSATSNYGSSTFSVHIGGGGVFDGTGNFFWGQIDEVAIFDKAISAERIAAHFEAGKNGGVVEEPEAKFTKITVAGGNVTVEWTGGGTLQSAASVLGPWTDVAGATSPHSTAATAAGAYFRVRN
ncbi:MAG: Ig-like domain-containing protein [Verrucomicrobiales bacterium]|nr:Ig-like domain-containing protein [Verrucomicrobiales bacterium]